MSIIRKFSIVLLNLFWMTVQVHAADIKAAMVVSFSGTVEIFSALKIDESAKNEKLVIFDGSKFTSRRVQLGAKVHPGDILRSGNDGKMKIIYDNGDVFILGPATAFTIPKTIEKGSAPEVSAEVLYGKVRGMIDKKGPLSGVKIRTKTVVAGVRGTDLYVSFNPLDMHSQVHVLRGVVMVQKVAPAESPASTVAPPALVKTGQKAILSAEPKAQGNDTSVQVLSSTRQDLRGIQTATTTQAPALQTLKTEEKTKIELLLKISQEKVMDDIKETTPEIYKKLQSQKSGSLEDISQVMIQDLSKSAPKGSSKPKMSDFEKDEDVYQKYFKPVQK